MHKILLSVAFLLTSFNGWAQSFPSQPVRIVVPFPPGGSADVLARILQPKLNELWRQPVLVENKPGASANIGADHVAKSAPDGTTMLLATPALAVSAAVYKNLPYEAQRDLAPVAMLSVFPSVLVVHPSVPAKTPAELVQYAKANPGKLNFASAGNLSAIRFAFEHLAQITGMKAVHVPYKGSAPSAQAMISGESHTMMMTLVDALPHIKSGRLKPLAVTGSKRAQVAPDIPTAAESGAPGYAYDVWYGLVFSGGTPGATVEKANATLVKLLKSPELRKRFLATGVEPLTSTSAEFRSLIAAESAKWRKVVKAAGIKLQ